jgi:hypothetical protein
LLCGHCVGQNRRQRQAASFVGTSFFKNKSVLAAGSLLVVWTLLWEKIGACGGLVFLLGHCFDKSTPAAGCLLFGH